MKLIFHVHALSLNFGRTFFLMFKVEITDKNHGCVGKLNKIKIIFSLNDVFDMNISTIEM